MKPKSFLVVLLMVCLWTVAALAADKTKDNPKNALDQLKAVEKTSKDAEKDAKAGKLGSAKDKASKGFDPPAISSDTAKDKDKDTAKDKDKNKDTFKSTGTVTAQPVTIQDPKEIARRENEAEKAREKERAKKYHLDDKKKAPPKP